MKHNQHNPAFKFYRDPVDFNKFTAKSLLQFCLGGTLYMPGTLDVTSKILARSMPDMKSMVMCFEDAITEQDLDRAEANVLRHLDALADAIDVGSISHDDIPLTFLRVRTPRQFANFSMRLTDRQANVLSGFVFPKFCSTNAQDYLHSLMEINTRLNVCLYGMPIFEGRSIAFMETRTEELTKIKHVLDQWKECILNVRVGATDFSAIFGVRRDINTSIYNIFVVCDCLTAILNIFNREEDEYTVSAPVWEYFLAYKKEDINRLLSGDVRQPLFKRSQIINEAVDGLIREVVLDKANGFVGKTVIHPSHLRFVNGIQAVTREEYEDTVQILGTTGGVVKSASENKMNEINPHRSWAQRTARRADAYGVVDDDKAYLELILGGDS
jgi:citrate lyase beta subunit